MTWVLDASAAYLATENEKDHPGADATRDLLAEIDDPLIAPELLAYELAHLVFSKYADRVDDIPRRVKLHAALAGLAQPQRTDWEAVGELCDEHGLTAYDAAYVELAKREEGILITDDREMYRVAKAVLGEERSLLCRGTA